ncbi:uncharacterized protein LOC135153700 [Lytechinus pictus]|uniref:uncharacterized protein LOC135153700 n=1 Tax=Lytechinus pictus TaxID=7653 RepID=UPI0030BA09E4
MGKTRAEIQKAYRERKKNSDPMFLAKERKRQINYRVPVSDQKTSALKKIRKKNRMYQRKFRQRKKDNEQPPGNGTSPSSKPAVLAERRNSRSTSPLLVQFSFPKKNTARKRSKALRSANNKIKELETKNKKLNKEVKKVQKRIQRLDKKRKRSSPRRLSADMTPKSKTSAELQEAGLDLQDLPPSVHKKLLFANVLTHHISVKRKHGSAQQKQSLRVTVSGKVIKKYKCARLMNRQTGIDRRAHVKTWYLRSRQISELQKRIISFYERDDVSRCMPGKRDATKAGSQKLQNRVLTDYLQNTHAKFCSDNPDVQVSLSKFCKLRPSHVKLTSLLSRATCLCTSHQNMAFKLKALRNLGLDISLNPETAAKIVNADEMKQLLSQVDTEEVDFEAWMKVEVNGMKKMRIDNVKKSRADFITLMQNEYISFLEHVGRVRAQYKAILELKDRLPQSEAIVQMDFAENFVCQSAQEIQSAYWNSTSTTLHPTVTYYRDEDGKLQHKSIVFVSDLGDHNSKAVMAILNKLVPILKTHIPDLRKIHYWTDSPSSQYRNRFIFSTLCQHNDLFGVKASWDYFECGHGKSVCDGIGGTAKRQASDAVKQGKAVIQDATDFFAWASSHEKEITYVMYSKVDYDRATEQLSSTDCQPIPGTMKIHSVHPTSQTKMLVRHTSCYCENCVKGQDRCDGWMIRTLKPKRAKPSDAEVVKAVVKAVETVEAVKTVEAAETVEAVKTVEATESVEAVKTVEAAQTVEAVEVNHTPVLPAVDEYVAAVYSGQWYLGKVLEVDLEDRDAKITFMTRVTSKKVSTLMTFKWPDPADKIWIPFDDILTTTAQPTGLGKSERKFELTIEQFTLIEDLAKKYKEAQIK